MDPIATHQPLLVRAALRTEGPMIELGAGYGSTLILHEIATAQKRLLWTLETDRLWYQRFMHLGLDGTHTLQLVDLPRSQKAWDVHPEDFPHWSAALNFRCQDWGLVFIDHGHGGQRASDVLRFKNRARVILVHDSDDPAYHLEPSFAQFRYRYDYTWLSPHTTAVSDEPLLHLLAV